MKKIMLVYNNMGIGGIQVKIIDILTELLRQNFHPILILRKAEGQFMPKIPLGVEVVDLNLGKSLFDAGIMTGRVSTLIRRYNPSKILTFADHVSLITFFARSILGSLSIKQIVNEGILLTPYLKDQPFGYLRKFLVRKFYPRMSQILVLTKAQKNDLVENFDVPKSKITVISNWVSKIYLRNGNNILNRDLLSFKVDMIFIGRLVRQKNLEKFLKVSLMIKNIIPEFKAVIVGDGPQKEALINRAENLGLSNSIDFVGFRPEPKKYYENSKIFLLTSLYEGQPHAVMEAMWLGVPVVAFKFPGVEEMITNGKTGFIVSNISEAVRIILLLLSDELLRSKIAGSAMAEAVKKFSYRNIKRITSLLK